MFLCKQTKSPPRKIVMFSHQFILLLKFCVGLLFSIGLLQMKVQLGACNSEKHYQGILELSTKCIHVNVMLVKMRKCFVRSACAALTVRFRSGHLCFFSKKFFAPILNHIVQIQSPPRKIHMCFLLVFYKFVLVCFFTFWLLQLKHLAKTFS